MPAWQGLQGVSREDIALLLAEDLARRLRPSRLTGVVTGLTPMELRPCFGRPARPSWTRSSQATFIVTPPVMA